MHALICLSLALLLCLGLAQSVIVIKPGKCPAVAGQPTLNAKKYLGTWYEYERFPAIFELGLQCTTAHYGLTSDGKISVTNDGLFRVKLGGKYYVLRNSSIKGTAYAPDKSKPAELSVTFFGSPGDSPNYIIRETDYTNYSVVFSCTDIPILNFNVQFAWILTRERGKAPSNLKALENLLSGDGVDVSPFSVVDQNQCGPTATMSVV